MDERGFIVRWFLLTVIALAALYYFFEWSIFDAAASEEGQNTIGYIKELFFFLWEKIKSWFSK